MRGRRRFIIGDVPSDALGLRVTSPRDGEDDAEDEPAGSVLPGKVSNNATDEQESGATDDVSRSVCRPRRRPAPPAARDIPPRRRRRRGRSSSSRRPNRRRLRNVGFLSWRVWRLLGRSHSVAVGVIIIIVARFRNWFGDRPGRRQGLPGFILDDFELRTRRSRSDDRVTCWALHALARVFIGDSQRLPTRAVECDRHGVPPASRR